MTLQEIYRFLNKRVSERLLFFSFGITIPLQLGKHFWPQFSFVSGVRMDYLAPVFYLSDIILLIFLGFYFAKFKALFTNFVVNNKAVFGLLFAILIFNFFLASIKWLFVYRFYQYLKIILVILIFRVTNKEQINYFLNGLFVSSCLALSLAIAQIQNNGSLQGFWYYLGERQFTINTPGISTVTIMGQKLLRPYAFFSHPNSMAGFYLVILNLSILFKKPALVLLSGLLIVLTFSKFSILILAFILLIYFRQFKTTCVLCKISKFFLLIWLIFFTFIFSNNANSLFIRFQSNLQAISYINTHPLGLGLGHYLFAPTLALYQPVHNIFLLLTFELGILIWPFILWFLSAMLKKIKESPQFWLLFTTLLLIASFDHYLLTLNQNMVTLGIIGIVIGFLPNPKTAH